MQQAAAVVWQERSVASLEADIASVKEIFRLQNAAELDEAETRYLPSSG
jgi:phosphoenolpyruvate phosphomutase